jgi:predicted DNA-binding protein
MSKSVKEIINYEMGIDEAYFLENALERICEIDENITAKKLLEILKKPIDN